MYMHMYMCMYMYMWSNYVLVPESDAHRTSHKAHRRRAGQWWAVAGEARGAPEARLFFSFPPPGLVARYAVSRAGSQYTRILVRPFALVA